MADIQNTQERLDKWSDDAPPVEIVPLDVYADEPAANAPVRAAAASDAGAEPEPFQICGLDEISDEQPSETVQKLYGPGQVIAKVGAPNAGKTALAIDHGLSLAANATWFGLKVSGGPVVYFASEAHASVVMRAKAAKRQKFPDRRLPFYISSSTPELGDEANSVFDCKRVIATIRAVESTEGEPVKLVQIDTLASCLGGGDENSDGMIRLVAAAKHIALTIGCAVMLIHHPSKSDSNGLRGHGSLAAACDAIIAVSVDEASGIRTATLTKSRDSATGLQFCYRLEQMTLPELDSFGDPRTTIIVKSVGASDMPRKRPGGKAQDQLLTELERRHRTGETSWDRATVLKAGRGIGLHRNTASTACSGLAKAGFITGTDSRLTLKDPPEECT
jgi:AAA domain